MRGLEVRATLRTSSPPAAAAAAEAGDTRSSQTEKVRAALRTSSPPAISPSASVAFGDNDACKPVSVCELLRIENNMFSIRRRMCPSRLAFGDPSGIGASLAQGAALWIRPFTIFRTASEPARVRI